jgi:hypothetical protein
MKMRIAIRQENGYWNAYFAEPDNMKDAILLGSIVLAPIKKSPELREEFLQMMRRTLEIIISDITDDPTPLQWHRTVLADKE